MEVKDELFEKMKSYHDAQALAEAYEDLNDLLKKYEEKITRQLNQAKRRNETLKKGNASASTRTQSLENEGAPGFLRLFRLVEEELEATGVFAQQLGIELLVVEIPFTGIVDVFHPEA